MPDILKSIFLQVILHLSSFGPFWVSYLGMSHAEYCSVQWFEVTVPDAVQKVKPVPNRHVNVLPISDFMFSLSGLHHVSPALASADTLNY